MTQLAPPAHKHETEVQHLRYERITEEQRLSNLQIKLTEKMQTRNAKAEMRTA